MQNPLDSGHALSTSQVGRQSRLLLHPLVLFLSVWVLSFLLYAMHLSDLLTFSTTQVFHVFEWIVVPYVVAILLFEVFCALAPKQAVGAKLQSIHDVDYLVWVESRLFRWFTCWCALTLVEVFFSGGLPILWLIQGSSRNYVTFGLPVLHVFLNSLLAVLALSEFGMYILLGDKRRLLIPCWLIFWSIVVVSRGFVMVSLLQWGVLWLFLKGARIQTVFRAVIFIITVIVIFGYIGDWRTGGDAFQALAQPSRNYPDWLPSGFLWFYIYLTTPLGNLVNTSLLATPLNSSLFPNTVYFLFPTIIRNLIYGKDAALQMDGELVTDNFNVSTAYTGPFHDYGYFGVVVFSTILAIIAAYYWRKRQTFRDGLIYTLVAQCLMFSIFTNFLFYNPFLGQVFWIYFLFRNRQSSTETSVLR